MQIVPDDIQIAGNDLAIRWNDGAESYLPLEMLRRACPCAGCCGEPNATGRVDKPSISYDPARSFQMRSYAILGGYAFQPVWGDGHATGLYSFEMLRRLAPTALHTEPA